MNTPTYDAIHAFILNDMKASSAKKYNTCLLSLINLLGLKFVDVGKIFTNLDNTIEIIKNKYPNPSTRKGYFSMLLKVVKRYYPDDKKMKMTLTTINVEENDKSKLNQNSKNQDSANKRPYQEALDIMEQLKEKYKSSLGTMGPTLDPHRRAAIYLHLILFYGQMRADEFKDIIMTNDPGFMNNNNHINTKTGEVVIWDHKTVKKDGPRRFKTDAKFTKLVSNCDGLLFISRNGPYAATSGLTKFITKNITCGHELYDIRKAKVSIEMRTYEQMTKPSVRKLDKLANVHGHTKDVMMVFYDKYSLNKPFPKHKAIDEKTAAEQVAELNIEDLQIDE